MRSVTLKSTGTAWVLAPGAENSFRGHDVLIVREVPDGIADAAVAHVANQTMINTPTRAADVPSVPFARLGAGNAVNLVIGRPPVPEEQRKDVEVVTTRMEGAERRAKFRRLGRAWLERQVDRAKEPE